MTEKSSTRRHAVVTRRGSSRKRVKRHLFRALASGNLVEVWLQTDTGEKFPVMLQLNTLNRSKDGSYLLIGVTDLSVNINIHITGEKIFAILFE